MMPQRYCLIASLILLNIITAIAEKRAIDCSTTASNIQQHCGSNKTTISNAASKTTPPKANFQLKLTSPAVYQPPKVAFMVMATGKYFNFIPRLLQTARQYLFKEGGARASFFIFTDAANHGHLMAADVYFLYQKKMGWPNDTMMRPAIFLDAFEYGGLKDDFDFVFSLDADMYFAGPVGPEILGDLVATQHWYYVRVGAEYFPYEKRRNSTAFIHPDKWWQYYVGAFYGGRRDSVMAMWRQMVRNIDADLAKGIVAAWHEESHLNRYLAEHPPIVTLSPAYNYMEDGVNEFFQQIGYPQKIISPDKDADQMRS